MASDAIGKGKEWKPTSLEQKIIDMQCEGVKYVGDGKLFMTIGQKGKKRKKNPDFIVKGKKKVIEVGHEFWHPQAEILQTISDYNAIGYDCLYLTDKEMSDPSIYVKMIYDFLGIKNDR